MKVLIVFNHPAPYKVRLFNELAKSIDLEVIFERTKAKDRPNSFYNCNEYNFKYTFYKNGYFSNEQSFTNKLKKYIKKNYSKYDLVIMNGYSTITEMKAISYLRRNKLPYVLFVNGGIVPTKEKNWKKKLKTKYISSATWYLSPCEEADEYLLHYGANKETIFHYPYSTFYESEIIQNPLSENDKNGIRKKWNLPNAKIIVSDGQFIDRKNNETLIKAFKNRDEKLILIGNGPLKDRYIELIKEEEINNVELRPFMTKSDLFDLLKGCDAFITLSKEDIYGHTTTEAFANGLPVISSNNVVSSRHLIKNGENGYLVDINSNSEIQAALDNISYSMSENAINTAKENTIEATAKSILEAIKRVAK